MLATKIQRAYRHLSNRIPVCIDYSELISTNDLTDKIFNAFGKDSLGICIISNIPNYSSQRKQLLKMARLIASLPDEEKSKIENPESLYSKGWSQGKLIYKGKNNPKLGEFHASPDSEGDPVVRFPNLWPSESLPTLKPSFISLYRTIINTSSLLSIHLDNYVGKRYPNSKGSIKELLKDNKYAVGDLLYYYPHTEESFWNRWHTDHSSLTALTSAMYIDETIGEERKDIDLSETGLFIKNRKEETIKINWSEDCLAIQIGELIQLVSGGALQATPHSVMTSGKLTNVSRSTLATFIEPSPSYIINCPNEEEALIEHDNIRSLKTIWKQGISFKDFSYHSFQ